jgi:hypothetical protein
MISIFFLMSTLLCYNFCRATPSYRNYTKYQTHVCSYLFILIKIHYWKKKQILYTNIRKRKIIIFEWNISERYLKNNVFFTLSWKPKQVLTPWYKQTSICWNSIIGCAMCKNALISFRKYFLISNSRKLLRPWAKSKNFNSTTLLADRSKVFVRDF